LTNKFNFLGKNASFTSKLQTGHRAEGKKDQAEAMK